MSPETKACISPAATSHEKLVVHPSVVLSSIAGPITGCLYQRELSAAELLCVTINTVCHLIIIYESWLDNNQAFRCLHSLNA